MLDILIIIIIGLNMLVGYRRGFVSTVLSLAAFILAIIFTRMFHPAVAAWLRTTPFYEGVVGWIADHLQLGDMVSGAFSRAVDQVAMPIQQEVIGRFPLPQWMLDFLDLDTVMANLQGIEVGQMIDLSGVEMQIASHFAGFVIDGVSVVGLFLVLLFLLRLVATMGNLVTYLPVIHSLNKTVGTAAGAVKGMLAVWIMLILYVMFFLRIDSVFYDWYYGSSLALWLNERNLILNLFLSIIG